MNRVPLETLLKRRLQAFNEKTDLARIEHTEAYSSATGFHIYAALRLMLKITASTKDQDSRRYLRIIQDCSAAAVACAQIGNTQLLEVQAEKLHFFLPADDADPESVAKVLLFTHAFAAQIYKEVMPRDPSAWKGFAMATDHGPTVFVHPPADPTDSIVSLSVAANTPAKALDVEPIVPSGHLAIPEFDARVQYPSRRITWRHIPIEPGEDASVPATLTLLNARMKEAVDLVLNRAVNEEETSLVDARRFLSLSSSGTLSSPSRVIGYILRADLDGFSSTVSSAFSQGEEAVSDLARRFFEAMTVPTAYAARLNALGMSSQLLPWEGDCASVLIFPASTYQDSRGSAPYVAALEWHELESNGSARRWALGVCGGGDKEGANGALLLADIEAGTKSFRVVTGWGAKRALDAQQNDGLRGTETAIHREDHQALEECYAKAFHGSADYRKATHEGLRGAREGMKRNLVRSEPARVAGLSIVTPRPKPYYKT